MTSGLQGRQWYSSVRVRSFFFWGGGGGGAGVEEWGGGRSCDNFVTPSTFVAAELCKLAQVTGPEFPHPFSPVGRCLPATGRCRAVRYKRQCLPGFCAMC